jgi:hypothetical protein
MAVRKIRRTPRHRVKLAGSHRSRYASPRWPGSSGGAAHSRLLAGRGLADRVSVVAGDFFEAVPPADIYLMSKILHDWDDKSCSRLLASIATAARPGARLVVLEQVVPDGDQPHISKMLDLTMLVTTAGKERTAAEFQELFASADSRLDQIVQTPTPLPILEATLTQT